MRVSSRQRAIIEILLQEQKSLTIGAIAEQIGVSGRTVHRELDVLDSIFEHYSLKLARKAGAGVEVAGSPEQKQALRVDVLHQTTTEYTAQERRVLILCALLEATEPVKLISLALDLKVTTATISHDLDDLELMLSHYELTLLRKRGYGVELNGSESSKRRAISRLLADHLDDHQVIDIIRENIQNKNVRDVDSISERLLGLIDKEKLIKVENALNHLEEELPYSLADSAYIGLVTHLALAVERVEKGENIHFDELTLNELMGTSEYEAARTIMERLKQTFQMEIPAAEIGYITMHLRGAKLRNSQDEFLLPENAELVATTQRLIQYCEERLGIPLREDNSLFHGLLTHLEPALYRLKRKMEIRNPILDQIKANYAELFAVTKEAVSYVFPEWHVPDEEVGYLVMHLGAALERTRQEQQRYRALVVCSSGIGSSKILATRIKKEIPEIISLQNLSVFEVGRVPRSEYDLIISTIPLPASPMEYVVVSPLLPQEDIQKIKYHLHNTGQTGQKMTEVPDRPLEKDQAARQLKAMSYYTGYASELVEGLWVQKWDNRGQNREQLLTRIGGELQKKGSIRAVDTVVQQLLAREKLGGLGIPGTAMALFHGKSEEVKTVSFTLHLLEEPVPLKSMDEQEMSIRVLLLLLGPTEIPREGLEVLSEISSMLIEEETQSIFESGEVQPIADYIAGRLYSFCLKKTGLGRTK
ncbi:BglG family transcription antiterminator [Brevibacillus choshinensis]|uniref:BglG family transcription antiterminator n=1 Tax=Brevibacillus choshinensis TaxID=54911 RepID=UPI002E1D39C8|nr:BglG family transcription antiterminator [Brevibacillus choshinensis]